MGIICPHVKGSREESDWDRTLGITPLDPMHYVPAENGVLFGVERQEDGLWSLALYARACVTSMDPNDHAAVVYIPQNVALHEGDLVTSRAHGIHSWNFAEPDWVVETIDRLSRKPFVQPKGPQVQLVPRIPVTREEALAEEV